MDDFMTDIFQYTLMIVVIIRSVYKLNYMKKHYYMIEAKCLSYEGTTKVAFRYGIFSGIYEYDMGNQKYVKEIRSSYKPAVNKKCYLYVSKNNPEEIMPYTERKYYWRLLRLSIFVLVGKLGMTISSI